MYLLRYVLCTCVFVRQHLIKFGGSIYRKVGRIPIGSNCAPLIAYLILYYYNGVSELSLSADAQTNVIKAFKMAFPLLG